MGEQVLAWVKLRTEATATDVQLRDFCRKTLAHFKIPRFWKFVDEFPTTVTGKIQKYRMRSTAIAEMGLKDTTEPTNR
jgi:fatty-acyl-CoA synthase